MQHQDQHADEEEDYDDEDYVPESLRGFLEEADKQLQAHKDDILNFDEPMNIKLDSTTPASTGNSNSNNAIQVPHKPKEVPNPGSFVIHLQEDDEIDHDLDDDDDDDDDEIFVQILQKEGDQQLAHDLLQGIQQERTSGLFSPLQEDQHVHADFLSPAMSDITAYTNYGNNPAAHLTESQAKRIAMEGATPLPETSRKANMSTSKQQQRTTPQQPRNLQSEMDGNANGTTTTTTSNWISPKGQQQQQQRRKQGKQVAPSPPPPQAAKAKATKTQNTIPRGSPPISQPPTPLQSPRTNPNTPRTSSMANTATAATATPKSPPPPLHPTPPKSSRSSSSSSQQQQQQQQQNNNNPDAFIPNPPSKLSDNVQMQVHVDQQGGVVLSKRRPIPADKGSIPTRKSGSKLHPKVMPAVDANTDNTYDNLPQPPSGQSFSSENEPSPQVSPNVNANVDSNTSAAGWKPPKQQQQQQQQQRKNSKRQQQQPMSIVTQSPAQRSALAPQQQQKTKVPSYMRATQTAARRMDRMRPAKLDIPGGGDNSSGDKIGGSAAVAIAIASTAIAMATRQPRSKPTPESRSQQSSSVSGYSGTTATTIGDASQLHPYGGRAGAKFNGNVNPRLLQGTAASKARLEGPCHTLPMASSSRKNSSPISSRLLQKTAASRTRESNSSSKDDSDQQAAARDRDKNKLERDRQSQERSERRQRQAQAKSEKIQQSLRRARERREKVEQQDRDRIAKLEAKLLEKENKHPTPSSRDGPMRAKLSGPRPKYVRPRKVTPTIPIAPVFATDSRGNRRERPKRDEHVTLANSDEMLKNYLRRDEQTPVRTSGERPALTIPQGPKLATAARHGDKTPAAPILEVDDADVRQWQGGLRSVSSPAAAERPHKLTIPHTPKFQDIKKRELPKSTAEKEMEVIEYYKSHPFKANPVQMQDLSTPPVPRKKSDRRLTTPEPFHLSNDDRAEQMQYQDGKIEHFRARPMPDFSATKKIPLTGKTPKTEKKKLTHPQPFNFHTVDRASSSVQSHSEPEGDNVQFRARPVPNFVRHSGLVIHRDPDYVRKSRVETPPQTFKALPMPKFSTRVSITPLARKAGKPLTTPTPFQFHTEERASHTPTSSTTHGSQPERFKARTMPNFAKAAVPVRDRDPERTRSIPKHLVRMRQEEPQPKSFRAKSIPNTHLEPSIPVRERNSPTKRITQEPPSPPRSLPKHLVRMRQEEPQPKLFRAKSIPKTHLEPSIPVRERNSPTKRTTQEPPSPPKPFRAKPLPKSFTKPTIPVKDRDPMKLRSPDAVMRPKERDEEELGYVFKAKPVPDFFQAKRDPPIRKTVIPDPQGASPPKASARGAKSSLRARMVERQSGSTASSSRRESKNKFSTSKVKQRLEQAKTVPYGKSSDIYDEVAIAGDVGMLCGVPPLITMPLVEGANAVLSAFIDPRESSRDVAAKKQTNRLQKQAKKQEPRTRPPRQEGETDSKRQLRAASEAWVQESQSGTASPIKTSSRASPSAKASVSESRAEDERARKEALLMSEEMEAASQAEASERSRHDDFLQQAYEVERAAEDEISYHGSSRHERTIGVDPSDVDAFWNYNGSRR